MGQLGSVLDKAGGSDTGFAFQRARRKLDAETCMLKQNKIFSIFTFMALLWTAGCEKPPMVVEEVPDKRSKPDFTNALCWISGDGHSESGFLCSTEGKPYVVTSESALQAESGFAIQSLDGTVWKTKRVFVSAATEAVMIELMEHPEGMMPVQSLRLPDPAVKPGDTVLVLGVNNGTMVQRTALLGSVGQDRLNIGRLSAEMSLGSMAAHVNSGKAVGVVLQRTWLSEPSANIGQDAVFLMSEPKVERFVQRLDQLAKWEVLDLSGYRQREAALKQSQTEVKALLGYLTGQRGSLVGQKVDPVNFSELHAARKRYAASAAIRDLSQSDRREAKNRLFRDVESLLRRAESRCLGKNWSVGQTVRTERMLRMVKAGLAIMEQTKKNKEVEDAFFNELY